jgi:hypothetical protein
MRCAICKTDLGKPARNPGRRVCGGCFQKYEGRYDPREWKVIADSVIAHKALKCVFRIEGMKAKMVANDGVLHGEGYFEGFELCRGGLS